MRGRPCENAQFSAGKTRSSIVGGTAPGLRRTAFRLADPRAAPDSMTDGDGLSHTSMVFQDGRYDGRQKVESASAAGNNRVLAVNTKT